ncbi:MAG: L,D-transpeptidase [Polyangiaceae bacterium]|nr:L,D-transpeptidase [Polyangiaceae bacterium]
MLLGAGAIVVASHTSACRADPPPGASIEGDLAAAGGGAELGLPPPPAPAGDLDKQLEQAGVKDDTPPVASAAGEQPYGGPWLGALADKTPVYETARFSSQWQGYLRKGAKVAVIDKPIRTAACRQGFYPLVGGGYVCGKYATLDLGDARVRLGIRAPNLDAALPYRYAYNNAHGTPLYQVVPTPEQMYAYEPYLKKPGAKDDKPPKEPSSAEVVASAAPDAGADPLPVASAPEPATSREVVPAAVDATDAGLAEEEPEKPWWQKPKGEQVNVTLKDLDEHDGVIAKRMVKGFFIAIDRTFGLNSRIWYKSTSGLVAPADRMIIPKTPETRGIVLGGGVKAAGFVVAQRAHKYAVDAKRPKRGDKLPRHFAVGLTGRTELYDKTRYRETVDGYWLKDDEITYTEPGERPGGVGPAEKWIDVNLSKKTLVAFEGDTPAYAALVSPGKRSSDKRKDHRTKTGSFRIREKHVAITMDGDGIAGDAPYSIEDVPYVEYYDGSYALHAAFWHDNFGREQSHGCVNLAPEDAKHIFMWTDPALPPGWHGVWATGARPGSMVVIHE